MTCMLLHDVELLPSCSIHVSPADYFFRCRKEMAAWFQLHGILDSRLEQTVTLSGCSKFLAQIDGLFMSQAQQ